MVWPLQAECDRHETRCKVDDAARNKEWRYAAWAPLVQRNGGFGDAFDTAYAGTDEHTRVCLVVVACWMPSSIVERLMRGTHCEDYKLVDFALLFRLHPLIGIIGTIRAITARDLAGNFARDVRDVETINLSGAALSLEQMRPGWLNATS